MATNLTSKGQVTIPKRIRDSLRLQPGMPVEFDVNAQGEVVIRPAPARRGKKLPPDRFDAVRGSATLKYRSTDELMTLLRDPVV